MQLDYNFECPTISGLHCISEVREKQIGRAISEACMEIMENNVSYEVVTPDGQRALHKGKVLQRLLQGAYNPQEHLFINVIFLSLMDKLCEQLSFKEAMDSIKEQIKTK